MALSKVVPAASALALDGRVAVVVGATRGIGKGIALELAQAGALVYVAGRTVDPTDGRPGSLVETVRDIEEAGGRAVAVRCDATDDASLAGLVGAVREGSGRLDLLVNSAFDSGSFRHTIGIPFWESPVALWDDVVDLGTRAAYAACVLAAPLMLETDGIGLIVNVSGRAAQRYRYNVAYGVGKAALDRITADMAVDLRGKGVAVVSLWPATIRTENIEAMAARNDPLLVNLPGWEEYETPSYVGRSVVALAGNPGFALGRSGTPVWSAELGAIFGFTDEHGRTHPVAEWPNPV
jgi:dehydrogenase/reductase SDR family member 1